MTGVSPSFPSFTWERAWGQSCALHFRRFPRTMPRAADLAKRSFADKRVPKDNLGMRARDCFASLAMTGVFAVIASEAKQSRAREDAFPPLGQRDKQGRDKQGQWRC